MKDESLIYRNVGTELILTAIREAEWLCEEKLSNRKLQILQCGTTDPIGELEDFCNERLELIVDGFGLDIEPSSVANKIRALLATARGVRAKHPLPRTKRRGSYQGSFADRKPTPKPAKLPKSRAEKTQPPSPNNLYSASRLDTRIDDLFSLLGITELPPITSKSGRGRVATQHAKRPVIVKGTQLELPL